MIRTSGSRPSPAGSRPLLVQPPGFVLFGIRCFHTAWRIERGRAGPTRYESVIVCGSRIVQHQQARNEAISEMKSNIVRQLTLLVGLAVALSASLARAQQETANPPAAAAPASAPPTAADAASAKAAFTKKLDEYKSAVRDIEQLR